MSIFKRDGGSDVENVGQGDPKLLTPSSTEKQIQSSVTDVKEKNPGQEESEKKDVVVMVDGPLSEIYTRALNTMFKQSFKESPEKDFDDIQEDAKVKKALESYVGMGKGLFEQTVENNPVQGAYVYVASKEDMDKPHETLAIGNRINKNSKSASKGFLLIDLENNRMVTERQAVLEGYAESLGFKVFHSKKSLLKGVRSWLSL